MLTLVVAFLATAALMAQEAPCLLILKRTNDEVKIPIATIQKIAYDKTAGTEMYVYTTTGKDTYQVSEITRMTLENVPEPTAVEDIEVSETVGAMKFFHQGTIYIVKDGQIYTLKGEKL